MDAPVKTSPVTPPNWFGGFGLAKAISALSLQRGWGPSALIVWPRESPPSRFCKCRACNEYHAICARIERGEQP